MVKTLRYKNKNFLGIGKKVSIVFFVLFSVFIALISTVNFIHFKAIMTERVLYDLSALAESKRHEILSLIENDVKCVALITSRTRLRRCVQLWDTDSQDKTVLEKEIQDIAKDAAGSIGRIKRIEIYDKNGVRIGSAGIACSEGEAQKDFFSGVKVYGAMIEDCLICEGEMLYAISSDLYIGDSENVCGHVRVYFDLKSLEDILTDYEGLGETGELVLARMRGEKLEFITPLRHADDKEAYFKIVADSNMATPMRLALNGKNGIITSVDYRGKEVLAAHKSMPEFGLGLVAKIDTDEAFSDIRVLQLQAVIIGLVGIVFATAVILVFSGYISKPIFKLMTGIDMVKRGHLDYKVGVESNDEIGILANAFDEMTANLKESTISIKRLKEEVEHRRLVEEQLKNAKEYVEKLFSFTPSAIFTVNAHRFIVSWNKRAEEITGYSAQEMIGKTCSAFAEEPCAKQCGLFSEDVEKPIRNKECTLRAKDGRLLTVLKNADILKDSEGNIIGGIESFEDITQQKEYSEQLKSIQTQLIQSEKMAVIGQLAAGVAHEINNPTGFVMSNLDVLKDYVEKIFSALYFYERLLNELLVNNTVERDKVLADFEKVRDSVLLEALENDMKAMLSESEEGARRIKDIVANLKSFAHPDEHKRAVVDINDELDKALTLVWNELKYKCEVIKEYGELPKISINPSQIGQVFVNLLINASQAIEKHGKIIIQTCLENNFINIRFEDTGKGVSQEKLDKIFEPFYTTKKVGEGTGLGLSIAYGIVKKHKGQLLVTSKEGVGTVFEVKLPVGKT